MDQDKQKPIIQLTEKELLICSDLLHTASEVSEKYVYAYNLSTALDEKQVRFLKSVLDLFYIASVGNNEAISRVSGIEEIAVLNAFSDLKTDPRYSTDDVYNLRMLEEIVRTDNKQRFAFNPDHTKIRANQGHSIEVDVELKEQNPPEVLYHGTGTKNVSSILKKGLLPQSRLYVHLSKDIHTAIDVGQRHGKPAIFTIQAGDMSRKGYKFFLSKNRVWLTKYVPAEYLKNNIIYPGDILPKAEPFNAEESTDETRR